LPVGLVVWHLEDLEDISTFRLVEVNLAARKILGLPIDINLDIEQIQSYEFAVDPFPAFLKIEPPEVYAEVVRTGTNRDLGEIRYRNEQKIERIFSIQAFPLPQQRIGLVFEDISDRKQTEEIIRQSEQKLLFHVQQTPLAVIEWGVRGQVLEWNPAAEVMFGYKRSEAIGQFITQLITLPEQQKSVQQLWDRQLKRGNSTRLTYKNVTKEGRQLICEWYHTPLVDEQGEVISIISLAQDVTQRQQAQAAIRASEVRYRQLFEAAQDGILILDAETGAIKDANPFILRLLGYSLEEIVGKKLWDLGLIRQAEEQQAIFHQLQTQHYIRYEHLPLKTADGHPIEVEFVSTVYWLGEQQIVQCNIRNITDRRRQEEALKQFTARLEQSNRDLQDFAFMASHDLQEPLRKIQTFGDRLQEQCNQSLSPEGQDYLWRMQNAAKRMQTLIDDLLTFSRVTTKAQPFTWTDLGAIAQEVLSDLEVSIHQTQAQIEIVDLPSIEADPLQMRQLLQNLIGNALKFHQPDQIPQIQIRGQILDRSSPETKPVFAPPTCQITVTDNGIGFDEKYLDALFMLFHRLHGRSEYAGNGIGLAICRKIVERHSGTITATSQPGQGATFIVQLPIHQ
jgi:PAS domain S-box-containing protein